MPFASILGISVQKVLEALLSQSLSLRNALFILGVLIVHWAVTTYVFQCPCLDGDSVAGQTTDEAVSIRIVYVSSFFIWPTVVFFILVLMSSRRCRRWLTGALRRAWYKHWSYCCYAFPPALVTSLSWVFFLLLDGRYYQCAASRPPLDCLDTTNNQSKLAYSQVRADSEYHKAVSQMTAWYCLGLLCLCAALGVTCSRACSGTPYYQQRYMEARWENEEESFVKISQNLLIKSTEEAWQKFLTEKKENENRDWASVSAISAPRPRVVGSQYAYSSLDLWHQRTTQGQSDTTTPPCDQKDSGQIEMSHVNRSYQNKEGLNSADGSVAHK